MPLIARRYRPLRHLAWVCLLAFACGSGDDGPRLVPSDDDGSGHTAPSETTRRANAAVLDALPFEDRQDFEDAWRGLLGSRENPVILDSEGREVWNLDEYAYQTGDAPDSVNPSLWRQAQLNNIHGLFRVTDGIYQVRGYDLANLTVIEGETGWIVVDPLTTVETAQAAMELVAHHLGERPVTAVVYTHSHIDHFGGARGVLGDADDVPVFAPEGFLEEAVSENVLAGNTMARRASYMFGIGLPRGPRGHVDSGLGKTTSPGRYSLVAPSEVIRETGTERVVDGVRIVFQNTPGAEAPAEMMLYLPDHQALCGAENTSHVLHNVYTLRGAKVRDALRWSNYLDEALGLFPEAEVLFSSHHWPTWGRDRVVEHLALQRDAYKFIHDQTLRLANQGYTPREIAEQIALPPRLARTFANRDYYGTVRHNAKAVYQHYFGWFDGNPANLNPLPPAEAGARYVAFMGGPAALLEKARSSYEAGEYRWVATVLDHLVFAEPDNAEARGLLADAYDQLAYQAESGPWRDFYLKGAEELRSGIQDLVFEFDRAYEVVSAMPTALFFDALAVRIDGEAVEGESSAINFVFTDIGETHVVELENSVLHHRQGEARRDADATIALTRSAWNDLVTKRASIAQLLLDGRVDLDGSRIALVTFFARLEDFDLNFPIVTP